MSIEAAFHRGIVPLLRLLLPGKEDAVLGTTPDKALHERIEWLAARNTEGELTAEELAEYEGYVRANKFAAVLRREALRMKEETGR
ncbi:MAG TPA: hypothetical protein PK490_17890 [Prosthecobacter sp.]|nr:hypothetical protein [Prosthecobacter sp.]HRK16161.1 hypothetical protein [Prosthecobacter sp.]